MKNSFMRITALVLAMLVCLSGIACGDSQPTDKDTDTVTQDTTPEETTSKWLDSLPDKDMNGTEINILTAAEQWSYFYDAEDDGDIVNDSVYARNKTVEERFNCKLNYRIYNGYMGGMSDVKSALTGSVMGGTKDFDLMVGSVSYVYPLIADNLFSDLKSCDQLSFDSQWWFNKINDEFEINGRLFLGASAYGILNTAWSVVTYFNKNVVEDFEIEDLYKLVLDGKWTFDKMNELAQKVTHDANGDNVIDDQDVVGIASTDDYIPWLSTSMGYKFTYKEDGKIKLNGVNDKLTKINDYIIGLFDGEQYFGTVSDLTYSQLCTMLANNHCLFAMHRLELAGGGILRDFGEFGVIPTPKYDESQKEYITPTVAEVSGIPLVVNDIETSAYILEALSSESFRTVLPIYFEKALKVKYLSDSDSGKMLDIISAGTFCDMSYAIIRVVPGWSMEYLGKKDIASYFAKNEKKWQENIDSFVATAEGNLS